MRAAPLLLAIALSLTSAAVAHATSPAWRGCSYTAAPRYYGGDLGLSLPANVPALPVWTEAGSGVTARFQDNRGTLRAEPPTGGAYGGGPKALPEPVDVALETDAHRPDVLLARPAGPLTVGQVLSLGLDLRCDGGESPRGGGPDGSRFRTTAPVMLPAQIGEIVSVGSPGRGGTGAVGSPETEIVVKVSPELAAYLPVAELSVASKDGTRIMFDYGAVEYALEGKVTFGVSSNSLHSTQRHGSGGAYGQQRRSDGVFVSFCGPDEDQVKRLSLELRAHVAGAPTDPPALPFEAEVQCVPEPEMNTCQIGRAGPRGGRPLGLGAAGALLAAAALARRRPRAR